jgi:hypothetical protein
MYFFCDLFVITVKTPENRWQITTRRSQKKDMKIDGE